MRSARRATLRDVAERVGVSVSTVSRSLNDDDQISIATRERVRAVADELGYVPDAAARSLAVRATSTVGLMIPDALDPVIGAVVLGFERAAVASGYSVIVAISQGDASRERNGMREFLTHRADGVALMGSTVDQEATIALAGPSPVVFLNTERLDQGAIASLQVGCLAPDDADGMRQIAEHLVAEGYRSIAYVQGDRPASGHVREEALRLHLRRLAGLDLVMVARWEPASLDAVARTLVAAGVDAVVGYDDRVALGLLDAFRGLGRSVPGDVAVVGFDDMAFAALANPRLTTVTQPAEELGAQAAAMLLAAIRTRVLAPSRTLPVQLVVRESSIRPPSRSR